MMYTSKKTLCIIGIATVCVLLNCIVAADVTPSSGGPIVSTIILDPMEPERLSTITFTATITSDKPISDVRIIVQECKESLCYTDGANESMTLIGTDTYQGTVTLTKHDTTYIKYHIECESNDAWYKSPVTIVNITTNPNLPKLVITPSTSSPKTGASFTVTIADDTSKTVTGATITFNSNTYTSDASGLVTLTAPGKAGSYPITATFTGYTAADPVTITAKTDKTPGFELLLFIIAVCAGTIALKRKRVR